MTFEDFKFTIQNNIKTFLPEEYQSYEIKIEEVIKTNGLKLTGLILTSEEKRIRPTIYLDPFFKSITEGASLKDTVKKLADAYVEADKGVTLTESDILNPFQFEDVKDHIITSVISLKSNKKRLEDIPFTKLDDLAITYKINFTKFANNFNEKSLATAIVTSPMLHSWNITLEELNKLALENTQRLFPAQLKVLDLGMVTEFSSDKNNLLEQEGVYCGNDLLVLCNKEGVLGANLIADPEIMQAISKKLEGDFYILPSSIHEVCIVRQDKDLDVKLLGQMVRDINATQVSPNERLSDHIYKYNSLDKRLEKVKESKEKSKDDLER